MLKNRWEYAWKVFCDPKMPWGRWFIDKLTSGRYSDYGLEIVDLNVEQHQYDGVVYADKFLQFTVDEQKQILHLEFQSTYDKNMCWRLLDYGLNLVEHTAVIGDASETYTLPDAFIVNVRPTVFATHSSRSITLKAHGQEATLTYPVVDVLSIIPEFTPLLMEKRPDKVREAILQLAFVSGGFVVPEYSDTFVRACTLVAQPRAYEFIGVDESIIEQEVALVSEGQKAYDEMRRAEGRQEGRKEGLQEAVRNLMQTARISEQEARRLLRLDTAPASQHSPGTKKMNLS